MEYFIQRMGIKNFAKLDYCFSRVKAGGFDPAEEISRQLSEIRANKSEAIVVKCPEDLQVVLTQARILEMGEECCTWILPQAIGHITSNLPKNLLAFDERHSQEIRTSLEEYNFSYLEDSFAIIEWLINEAKNQDDGNDQIDLKTVKSILKR